MDVGPQPGRTARAGLSLLKRVVPLTIPTEFRLTRPSPSRGTGRESLITRGALLTELDRDVAARRSSIQSHASSSIPNRPGSLTVNISAFGTGSGIAYAGSPFSISQTAKGEPASTVSWTGSGWTYVRRGALLRSWR